MPESAAEPRHLAGGWTVYAPADAPTILGALRSLQRERRHCGSAFTARESALLDVALRAARAATAGFVSETTKLPPGPDPEVSGVAGVVSVSEAATGLGLSEQYVRRLAADGRLAGRRVGRRWQIDAATVAALRLTRESHGRPVEGGLAEGGRGA